MKPSAYYDPTAIDREVAQGRHRAAIGGMWEEIGNLQLDFLKSQGLEAHHHMLDIGCGALRFGHLAVDYLKAGHYFGQDLSIELVEAGYLKELTEAQRIKLPRQNLAANAEFDFSHVNQKINYAIAQSVFTHLPFNHIRHCLARLAPFMAREGAFFATYFECPGENNLEESCQQLGLVNDELVVTTAISDPYHYRAADFEYAIHGLEWKLELLGGWGHPRGQKMLKFIKL